MMVVHFYCWQNADFCIVFKWKIVPTSNACNCGNLCKKKSRKLYFLCNTNRSARNNQCHNSRKQVNKIMSAMNAVPFKTIYVCVCDIPEYFEIFFFLRKIKTKRNKPSMVSVCKIWSIFHEFCTKIQRDKITCVDINRLNHGNPLDGTHKETRHCSFRCYSNNFAWFALNR